MFSPTTGSEESTTNALNSTLTVPRSPASIDQTPENMIDRDQFMQRNVLIRLNNAAIDFLQRYKKHRLCIDTLKDGLTLMKASPHDLSDSTTRSVREAWARAETRQLEAIADPESSSAVASDGTNLHGESAGSESSSAAAASSPLIVPNELGVVVLSSRHDPEEAYNLLATLRTSKVCLTLDPSDTALDLAMVRSILVYNYGIAHRCCSAAGTAAAAGAMVPQSPAPNNNKLESFCLQIFQYAETLLPPQIAEESEDKNHLLFRLVLTRNLMMLSCRLGLSLCEHYKETLDPIVADIMGPIVQLDNQKSEANDRASAA
jgi:hypothetical protein